MISMKACDWLIANVDDTPIRYRVIRDILGDLNAAKEIEAELLDSPAVRIWLKNSEIDEKINTIIDYISKDELLNKVDDGYGILQVEKKRYLGMGWDPKYPGWFDLPCYMETGNVPKLLFFTQYISKYPVAKKRNGFLIYWIISRNTEQKAEHIYSLRYG